LATQSVQLAAQTAAAVPVCVAHLGTHLTSARLSAVCAPIAVAIGIVVAYLTLDRFRYHKRLLALLDQLGSYVEPVEKLVLPAEGKSFTQVERNFLALHFYCGTSAVDAFIKEGNGERKSLVFNGGLDSMLSFFVSSTTQWRLDRRLSVMICGFLCMWELLISFILFRSDDPPHWLDASWAMWVPFFVVLLSYLAPVLGFAFGEYTVATASKAVKRWITEETTRQSRAAGMASLGQAPPKRARKPAA
jgi:hypothetical protein